MSVFAHSYQWNIDLRAPSTESYRAPTDAELVGATLGCARRRSAERRVLPSLLDDVRRHSDTLSRSKIFSCADFRTTTLPSQSISTYLPILKDFSN